MAWFLATLVLTLLAAGAVVAYVAFPARGRPLPGAPELGRRMQRVAAAVGRRTEGPPAYGVLSSPQGHRRAQQRFEAAERRILSLLRRGPAS